MKTSVLILSLLLSSAAGALPPSVDMNAASGFCDKIKAGAALFYQDRLGGKTEAELMARLGGWIAQRADPLDAPVIEMFLTDAIHIAYSRTFSSPTQYGMVIYGDCMAIVRNTLQSGG